MEYSTGKRLRELAGPLLLTGHTGFKGAWLTFLLEHLEVPVVGYSLPPEKGSLFERTERTGFIPETFADIRDYKVLEAFVDLHKPSTIIHMAAQPLVLKSYEYPRETFDVNVMGTVNVLDIAFKKEFVKAIVVVTTDKVYRNNGAGRAFIESDPLEGKDPYSASKVATEAVVAAWQQIAKVSTGPRISSVRAGNVIGGGDFAKNRIIPDLIRGVMNGKPVEIRNPNSTRPWQHVLDPLHGYLMNLEALVGNLATPSMNFGPHDISIPVSEIAKTGIQTISELEIYENSDYASDLNFEAQVLNLNSKLAKNFLNWQPIWTQQKAIKYTFEWWKEYLSDEGSAKKLCVKDIETFLSEATLKNSY